jgi:hypothetical protein
MYKNYVLSNNKFHLPIGVPMQAKQKKIHYDKNNVLNRVKPKFGRTPIIVGAVEQPPGALIP